MSRCLFTRSCFALLVCLTGIPIVMQAQTERGLPFLRNYLPQEYNGSPQIWGFTQDDRGILYFGSDGYLLEYDGVSWNHIKTPSNVYRTDKGPDGTVYLACIDDFGFLNVEGIEPVYQSLLPLAGDSIPIGNVWCVNAARHYAYFQTYEAIYRYAYDTKQLKKFSLPEAGSFSGSFLLHDVYYIRHSALGLMRTEGDSLVKAPGGEFFAGNNPFTYGAVPFSDNEVFIGLRETGLVRYRPDRTPAALALAANPSMGIYTALSYSDHYKVLGTASQGALLVDTTGMVVETFNESNVLANNSITGLGKDREQNIWIGTDLGVSKTETGKDFSRWDKSVGLRGGVYSFQRFHNTLYLAGSQRVYTMTDSSVVPVAGLPDGQYWSLATFREQQEHLLAGGFSGVHEITERGAKQIYKGRHAFIVHQSIRFKDRLYICDIPSFVSMRYSNNAWVTEGKWEGIRARIRSIVEEPDGTVWLGTYNEGLVKIVPNGDDILHPLSVIYFTTRNGLPSTNNCRPFLYKNDVLAGTEKGLYRLNRSTEQFEPYCELGNFLCDGHQPILFMQQTASGNILLAGGTNMNADLGYISFESGKPRWHYQPFRRLPSLSEIGSVHQEGNVFWIGSIEGLFRYDASEDIRNYQQPYQCLIRRVIAKKDSVLFAGANNTPAPIISYDLNSLRIDFAAPFFDKEERTRYSFRLRGYDTDWSAWSTLASKEYTNLHEGAYTFEVRAINIYDVESSLASFSFTITPPWYRTWWVYCLYTSFAASIGWILVIWRTRALRHKNEWLETRIRERTLELSLANAALRENEEELKQNMEELAAALENLTLTQNQLINSEKMASLGQLTAGLAHEINNPLNFVSGGVGAIKSILQELLQELEHPSLSKEELDERVEEINNLIKSVDTGVDRTIRIIRSLKTFSSPNVEINPEIRVDINECIETTLVLINSKIKDQNITLEKHLGVHVMAAGNFTQISQVILNIVENATHAFAPESTSRIIRIQTYTQHDKVFIVIGDNGVGIAPEHYNQILNPFFTTKEVGKGTGLGLSISYSIIKKHNGDLTFSSTPGKGTTFTISLPVS